MSSNKIGNTGAFDDFFPLLSESQKNEIDEFRKDYATRVDNRRMASPDSEIREIMGTMETMEEEETPVPERSRSALSRALETPQAQEITRQQRREKRRENELQALRQESKEEFRSASSASSSSSSSGSSRSRPRLLPFTCIWCGKNIFDYASPNEKINRLHKVCDTNYQFFFNRYYPDKPISYNKEIIKKVKNKFNQEKDIEDYNLLLKKKEIGWEKKKLDRLLENPEETNNSDRDKLFPVENPMLSGVPVTQTTEGEVKKFLDGDDNEEPKPDRYNTYHSEVAREIQAREKLKARRKKHEKMIAQNKTKCKKKDKKGRCAVQGGKKRRKTKKRRRKKRKTRRKRKSKKSKKRRRTRRK